MFGERGFSPEDSLKILEQARLPYYNKPYATVVVPADIKNPDSAVETLKVFASVDERLAEEGGRELKVVRSLGARRVYVHPGETGRTDTPE